MIAMLLNIRGIDADFEEVYKAYSKSIFNFCMSRLSYNEDYSADCTQQTFLVYYEKLKSGMNIENSRAYLYRIAENYILKKYSEIQKEQQHIETSAELETLNVKASDNSEESILEKLSYDELITLFKRTLKEDEFKLFSLKYIEGYKIIEIAQKEGITERNCSVKLFRIRKKLNEKLIEIQRKEGA